MPTIQIKNITFTYNGSYNPVFDQVSFNLDTAWKLGFTGRNGRGKTTFLRLLSGEHLGMGTLTGRIEHNTVVDHFPFAIQNPKGLTYEVVDGINPHYEHWALVKELNLLELDEEVLYRGYDTLSHGERTKVQLAVLFLRSDHFLLIDEPTNHLDARGRACVAAYLNKKRGYIIVSHDRVFLDGCIDHVLSINKTKIEIHQGNFSTYMADKARQDAFELAENAKLETSIRVLGEAVKRTAGWSDSLEATKFGGGPVDRGFIGAKSAKMMKRAIAIEKRRERAMDEKQLLLHDIEAQQPLELKVLMPGSVYKSGNRRPMISGVDLGVTYGQCSGQGEVQSAQIQDTGAQGAQVVLAGVSLAVYWGERIAITGGNGSGKSTLLKVLMGELPCQGYVHVDKGFAISYVSQDTAMLAGSLRDYIKGRGIDEGLFKSMLHKLDFSAEQFERPMSQFSAGQKKKVLLAASICDRAHLYIWDEPLNYIDVISRIQIEDMILKYQPTMIFVEHDQAFVNRVATRIVEL